MYSGPIVSGSLSSTPAPGDAAPEPSSFVGRRAELGHLARRMSEGRLVTIVGPAGSGKTRLAHRFASRHASGFAHAGGVWVVELRGASDVESARLRIAASLKITSEGRFTGPVGRTAIQRVSDNLGHALLVLDNAEHLLPELADAIIDLLDAAPRLHILVTSRKELGLLGEDVLDLGPMKDGRGDEEEAIDLFVARMRAHDAAFKATSADRAAIREVVRRVVALPLTLELCAATLSSPDALTRPRRSFPPTDPEAAALWALSRLPPTLKDVLVQCSVFRGSFDLKDLSAVVKLAPSHNDAPLVLVLSELVARCLVQEDSARGRYSICEGMRALAEKMRDASARTAAAQKRHAEHCARFATSASELEELALARDDLDAALAYAERAPRPDLVVALAIGLDRVSAGSGLTARQLAALDSALERAPGDAKLVARALGVRAAALRGLGRMEEAAKDAQVALTLSRQAGEERHAIEMLLAVGTAEFQLGELGRALARFDVAAFEARALELFDLEATSLQQMGSVRASMGDAEAAREHYEAALALAQRHGDELGEMRACAGLGSFFLEQEEHADAEEYYQRALLIADRAGARRTYRIVLGYLGILYFHGSELAEAERLLERAALLCRDVGDVRVEGIFEGVRAAVLAELDRVEESSAAFDVADRLLEPSPFFREVVRIARGHLDLAQARSAKRRGLPAVEQSHLRAARYRILASRAPGRGDEAPIIARSDDARMAVACLERAMDKYRQQ